jgi:hypothetical protein
MFLLTTECIGIILAKTGITRRSVGQIIRDDGALVLEAILRRDRAIIIAALSLLTVLIAYGDGAFLHGREKRGAQSMLSGSSAMRRFALQFLRFHIRDF